MARETELNQVRRAMVPQTGWQPQNVALEHAMAGAPEHVTRNRGNKNVKVGGRTAGGGPGVTGERRAR